MKAKSSLRSNVASRLGNSAFEGLFKPPFLVGLTGKGGFVLLNVQLIGLIAQLVEQTPEERRVVGSIPTQATTSNRPA